MNKTSKASKIVSFSYIGLLVVLFVTSLVYLGVCKDFEKPEKEAKPVQDTDLGDYSIYEYSYEDFVLYMEEKGIWTEADVADGKIMSTIGTINYIYNSIDVMWWDLDNLTEGSTEYDYWNEFEEHEKEEDFRYIMFGGSIYAPEFNGPFAIHVNAASTTDATTASKALAGFPSEYSGKKNHLSDAQNFFVSSGILASDTEVYESEYSIGSANRSFGGIELVWWDLDSIQDEIDTLNAKFDSLTDEEKAVLSEDTQLLANYNAIKDTGKVTVSEKELSYTLNGNFAIRLTEDFKLPEGFADTNAVLSAFSSWDTKAVSSSPAEESV